VYNEEVKAQI